MFLRRIENADRFHKKQVVSKGKVILDLLIVVKNQWKDDMKEETPYNQPDAAHFISDPYVAYDHMQISDFCYSAKRHVAWGVRLRLTDSMIRQHTSQKRRGHTIALKAEGTTTQLEI